MSDRIIRDELVRFTLPDGRLAVAMLPFVSENAPYPVHEGVARRRIVAIRGECPCGAQVHYEGVSRGRPSNIDVQHNRLCPSDTARLVKAIRRWAR